MSAESDLEGELKAALREQLSQAEGQFPEWGISAPSKRALASPVRSRRTVLPQLVWVGAAAVVILCVALAASMLRLAGPVPGASTTGGTPLPGSSCAGCGGSEIRAVAAFDRQNVVVLAGASDGPGSLLVLRSADGGKSWAVEHPNAPALTSIAVAGDRLYGSIPCLPQYPPDYALPSGVDVGFGSGVDRSFHPAPTSCLYYSDDRGLTWHDTGAGRLVDPSFADAMHGWAHAPYDALGKTATTLYSTTDGGRTWHAEQSPCDAAAPWIQQAISTGPGAGYVLCIGSSSLYAEPPQEADWELVRVQPGAAPAITIGSRTSNVPPNTGVGNFFMRADGTGWVYTDATSPALASDAPLVWTASLYRTIDGGQSWDRPQDASEDWPGMQSVSFVSAADGFAAFSSTGARSGVMATTDGGRTWHVLAAWDWWSLEPVPLPS